MDYYYSDSIDGIAVVCGTEYYGTPSYKSKSCQYLDLTTGSDLSWERARDTLNTRVGHSSWASSAGIVLMGGSASSETTEIWPGGVANFTLHRSIR